MAEKFEEDPFNEDPLILMELQLAMDDWEQYNDWQLKAKYPMLYKKFAESSLADINAMEFQKVEEFGKFITYHKNRRDGLYD